MTIEDDIRADERRRVITQQDTTHGRNLEGADCQGFSGASRATSSSCESTPTSRTSLTATDPSVSPFNRDDGTGLAPPAVADIAAGPQAGDRATGSGSSAGPDPSS